MQHGAGYKLHSSQGKVWCAQHSSQFIVGIFTRCKIFFRCSNTTTRHTILKHSYITLVLGYLLPGPSKPCSARSNVPKETSENLDTGWTIFRNHYRHMPPLLIHNLFGWSLFKRLYAYFVISNLLFELDLLIPKYDLYFSCCLILLIVICAFYGVFVFCIV